jgi:uncharacterized membrane protein YfcA
MLHLLSFIFGIIVGLTLGLTGGGGAILTLPLLVYGLGLPPQQAVGLSLLLVGSIALIGTIHRWWRREIDPVAGFLFAGPSMLATPLGTYISQQLNGQLLLLGYAVLILIVAGGLWHNAAQQPQKIPPPSPTGHSSPPSPPDTHIPANAAPISSATPTGPSCFKQRLIFIPLGLVTGLLAGLFGIGGGFLIAPTLVLIAHLEIHRATATSLLVTTLIGLSGTISHLWIGQQIDYSIAVDFILGGGAGMLLGITVSRHLVGPTLQRLFATLLILVALSILVQSLPH